MAAVPLVPLPLNPSGRCVSRIVDLSSMDFLTRLFGQNSFMPQGHCYLWDPGLMRLHLISDFLIAAAYFVIPITLLLFIQKRRDLPFNWMFVCFSVFTIGFPEL